MHGVHGSGKFASLAILATCILLTAGGRLGFAAAFVVTNTNDSGVGSLRQAILDANSTPGNDTITFNIPTSGAHQIIISTGLPALTDSAGTTIDGYSQPGASMNTSTAGDNAVILIEISRDPSKIVITGISVGSDNNVIQGLAVNGMSVDEIEVIGNGDIIRGNFIGTDPTGLVAVPSGFGGIVLFGSAGTQVGGPTAADRNLISGNLPGGGLFLESGSTGTVVQGNMIGLDATGAHPLPNFNGIEISSSRANVIGGVAPGSGNVIGGNQGYGVSFGGDFTTGNIVEGNVIGAGADRTTPQPNRAGIIITAGAGPNLIGGSPGAGNLIVFNTGQGVIVGAGSSNPAPGNAILSNIIEANAILGIDLGFDFVTPNDPGDLDSGPNGLQNFPVLNRALESPVTGRIVISGAQDSNPATGANQLQFFSSDGPGHGGAKALIWDASGFPAGAFAFALPSFAPLAPLAPGDWITATATTSDGTSEFSQNIQVVANLIPVAVAGSNQSATAGAVVTLDGSASFDPDGLPSGTAITDGFYVWSQVGGPVVALTSATSAHPSFLAAVPGFYTFSLVVSDGLDASTNTATVTITVNALAVEIPDASFFGHALMAIGLALSAAVLIMTKR